MLFKAPAQMHFVFMDPFTISWAVSYLQMVFSLPMHKFTSMIQMRPLTSVPPDLEMKVLITRFLDHSMTCCIEPIPMQLFISRPIKSCERSLQKSTQRFVHTFTSSKAQMVKDIISQPPMKLL
jgi:hypothetical protein